MNTFCRVRNRIRMGMEQSSVPANIRSHRLNRRDANA